MKTKKWPPIDQGTAVMTTKPNWSKREEWTDEGWARRKWGAQGKVIGHHDSHGLCYVVLHQDGTTASYDSSEIKIAK